MNPRDLSSKVALLCLLLASSPAQAHPHPDCPPANDKPDLPELAGATMSAPEQVEAGSKFEIVWNGPDDDYDHIALFNADGEHVDHVWAFGEDWPSPSVFRAPDRPGRYELRFTNAGDVVLARRAIVVTDVEASLSAPQIVRAGTSFLVEWTGPDNEYDFVGIYDAKGTLMSREFAFGDLFQSPTKFTAPSKPGTYEIRFVTGERPITVRSLMVR